MTTRYLLGGLSMLTLAMGACDSEPALAPEVPGPPLFVPGGTAAPGLLVVDAADYRQAAGGLAIGLGVNEGLFTATGNGFAVFAVEVTLKLSNGSGQTASAGPTLEVLIDKLAEPRPDPFVTVEVLVPWNGTDDTGAAMTGTIVIEYTARIVQILPNGAVGSFGGDTSGTLLVVIA